MSEPDSDRILVKKDNLARCAWCGTPESDEWITTQRNEIFCSSECRAARYAFRAIDVGFVFAFIGILMSLVLVAFAFRNPLPSSAYGFVGGLAFVGLMLLISGVGMMISGIEGKKYTDRKDKYWDVALLECRYCGQINSPNVTRCRYCSASLTKATFSCDTTPPWIRRQIRLDRFRCPHCNAIYEYDASKLHVDGTVRCQNCDRSFTPPHPFSQTDESKAISSLYSDV